MINCTTELCFCLFLVWMGRVASHPQAMHRLLIQHSIILVFTSLLISIHCFFLIRLSYTCMPWLSQAGPSYLEKHILESLLWLLVPEHRGFTLPCGWWRYVRPARALLHNV
jgi:hypothetical protein